MSNISKKVTNKHSTKVFPASHFSVCHITEAIYTKIRQIIIITTTKTESKFLTKFTITTSIYYYNNE